MCPLCQWREGTPPESPLQLPPRTVLDGRYLIGRALGQGGFGITYLGWDLNLNRRLAVKEFFPREICTRARDDATIQPLTQKVRSIYDSALDKFLNEGRALASLQDCPGVVTVLAFFQENGTGYIVMSYLEGLTFGDYLDGNGGKIDFQTALNALIPVMDTLAQVHEAGLLHRDISPDNLYITRDGRVKIIDFGAARYAVGEQSRSLSVILKHCYAPPEQYQSRGKQGPWTDVYALGATFYRAITGELPPPAMERLSADELQPPSQLGVQLPPFAETALLKALAVRQDDRFQSIVDFRGALLNGQVPPPPPEKPPEKRFTQPVRPLEPDRPPKPVPVWLKWGIPAALLAGLLVLALVFLPRHQNPAREQGPPQNPGKNTQVTVAGGNTITSPEPVRIGPRVAEANLIHKVQPVYPPAAKSAGVQGTVEFKATISKEGNVENLTPVRGDPLLVNAAREAIEQWKYRPTLRDGEPVEVITDILVNFTLGADRTPPNPPEPKPKPPIEPTYPPAITFVGDHLVITAGQPVNLRWSVSGATRVHIDPGFPALAPEGRVTASPTETTHYLLTAVGPGGTATKGVDVRVLPPVATSSGPLSIQAFTAEPRIVRPGSSVTLRWNVQGAARVTIVNYGVVPASGSISLNPLQTTTYTLLATGKDGSSVARQVSILVSAQ